MVSSLSEAGTGGAWPFRTRRIIFFMASSSLANCLAAAGSSASLADTIVAGRSLVLAAKCFISTLVLATATSIGFASWL